MNLSKYVPEAVVKATGRPLLHLKMHSPTILFAAGVTGAVVSTVLACKATLRLEEVLSDANKTLNLIDTVMDNPEYTEKERAKDKAILRVQTAVKLGKLYAPALFVGVVSVASLTGSHYIMSSRQTALMAAYAALDKGFEQYKARVREELGVEREEQLRYGSVITKTKDEDGKTVKATRVDPNGISVYARFFDETASEWQHEPEYNYLSLRAKQSFANNLLHSRGHLFLNEVYSMLGIEHSSAGAVVGWLMSPDGDNFVDFGIFNGDSPAVRDFVNGNEGAILLDFNVNGVIYDKLANKH